MPYDPIEAANRHELAKARAADAEVAQIVGLSDALEAPLVGVKALSGVLAEFGLDEHTTLCIAESIADYLCGHLEKTSGIDGETGAFTIVFDLFEGAARCGRAESGAVKDAEAEARRRRNAASAAGRHDYFALAADIGRAHLEVLQASRTSSSTLSPASTSSGSAASSILSPSKL